MSSKREGELLIPFLTFISDILVIEISFLLSYWLRFYSPLVNFIPVTKGFPPFLTYLQSSVVLVFIWIFIFHRFGLYNPRRRATPIDEFYALIKSVSLGMLLLMAATFFYRGFSYSRLVFLFIWISSIFLLTISRSFIIYYKRWRHHRGKDVLNVAIIGADKQANLIFENILNHPGLGFRVKGYFGAAGNLSPKTRHLGTIEQLPSVIRQEKIHVLILTPTEKQTDSLLEILQRCEGLNVEFLVLPDLLEIITSQLQFMQLGGVPLLQIKDVPIKGWNAVLKRAFDLICSLLGLIFLSPLFFIVSLLIKLDSRGSVFYKQERIGFDGKQFMLYKFRSMLPDAEAETGPIWATENDPRRTRIGTFLRRTSIDELPQLLNVLKGDMSLVGPRPERTFFVEKFKNEIPRYRERHRVKSGMTGWAQVNGLRGNTPINERTKYDIYYVENWSFAFDLKILLKTIWAVLFGKNNY